jgi:choline kinase
MNRFTRRIKGRVINPIQVIILAAGVGSRTKSYEPRCLLKYGNKTILDNQLNIFKNKFNNAEISVVCGFDTHRMIRKIDKRARVVENTNYENTNNGESLRLGINNSMLDNIIFLHSDLIISDTLFDKVSFDKSFIFVDSQNKFDDKEVGVTIVNNKANILSYSLPTKWCQIAYLNQNETAILRKLLMKPEINSKILLTFEIINKIIEHGGSFECYEIGNTFIKEIDTLKDIANENCSR